jgi:hypothetical protein
MLIRVLSRVFEKRGTKSIPAFVRLLIYHYGIGKERRNLYCFIALSHLLHHTICLLSDNLTVQWHLNVTDRSGCRESVLWTSSRFYLYHLFIFKENSTSCDRAPLHRVHFSPVEPGLANTRAQKTLRRPLHLRHDEIRLF